MPFSDAIRIGASGAGDYEVERSLRFNKGDNPVLTRSPSSTTDSTKQTLSFWFKISSLIAATNQGVMFAGGSDGSYAYVQLWSNTFYFGNSAGPYWNGNLILRDFSAWYHAVIVIDTTQSTANDRQKLYINGVQQERGGGSNPSEDANYEFLTNSSWTYYIGKRLANDMNFDGYMAEVNFVQGLALTPSSFAETDAVTGEYKPKKYTGGYGTNGFYLNFSDNSGTTATTLGKDSSGNSNNWTPNNFSVAAGKDDDSSFDSPTNNFPTLSPVDKSLVGTMSNGNLRISYNYKPASKSWRSTMALPSSGKFYWEWENEEASSNPGRWQTGLVRYTDEAGVVDFQGYNDVNYVSISFGGSTWNGTTQVNPPGSGWPEDGSVSFYSGERAAIAIDCSNGKWWLGVVQTDGSTIWYANDGGTDGDPAGGTNETATLPSFTTATEWIPHIVWHDGGGASSTTFTSNINFGNHSFLGTVPTGFGKLCSANLPAPTIKLPNKHFDILTYVGTAATHVLTGLNFQPDWFWAKVRSQSYHNTIMDSVRGTNKQLWSNRTNGEQTATDFLESFNSNGVTLGDNGGGTGSTNTNGNNYVGWFWNAGGSTVTNDDGSIESQVRANTSAGFSIVTYTGNNASATVGHGLGVAPKVVIVKRRNGTGDWIVGHDGLASDAFANNKFLKLESSSATFTNSLVWGSQPTSSVVQIVTGAGATNLNGSSDTYVMYCFSEVAGYSKFGKYTGNGNANGTFVYTGFRPAFVITRGTHGTSWYTYDNKRNTYNVVDKELNPNNNQSEATYTTMDFLSNGFKLRTSNDAFNYNNYTYIYIAFAESPFKYARAR